MKIKITFFGGVMLVCLVLTRSYLSLAALVAAALHELGHIYAARLCGIELGELKLDIFGAALRAPLGVCSYGSEILLAAAGPAVNLLIFGAVQLLGGRPWWLELFGSASLTLGVLNLMPIRDLDGGRIVYCLIARRGSEAAARRAVGLLSGVLICGMWMLSVYLLLRAGVSLSLFVFSISLFCRLFAGEK